MAARNVPRDRVTALELDQFIVEGVELTGNVLGVGAYGTVEEVLIPGAKVAAKKLHHQLIDFGSPEQVCKWISDFVEECKLMSQLRHPHVVQFLGICYLPGSHLPVLLMEELQTSLDSLLETTPNIPLDVKVYLLTGTGRGVVYLHSRNPPVIHRDLTARNILVDSGLTAKIADLGVARMVNIQPGQRAATMTQGPGNGLYMPPEAMVAGVGATRYNTSIDIFSFGVVSLFTLTQTFPKDLKGATYHDPVTRRLVARSEIERRADYIDPMKASLGEDHPLVKMTLDCLEYLPEDRPSAEVVLTRFEEVGSTIPQQCTETKLELIQQVTEGRAQVRAEVREEYQQQLSEKDAQIGQLQTANSALQADNDRLQPHVAELHGTVNQLQAVNSSTNNHLRTVQAQLSELQAANDRLQAEKQEQVDGLEELTTLQQQRLEVQRRAIERLSNQLRSLPLEGAVHRPQPQAKCPPFPRIPSSITFNWRRCKDRPKDIRWVEDHLVALNGQLYSRGYRNKIKTHTVFQYTPRDDQWKELPPPGLTRFAVAALRGQLFTVGGNDSTHKKSNAILTFDEHSQQWVQPYPVIPTALYSPAAIGYQDHLIVAGGENSLRNIAADVNILNTSTNKWITAEPLPIKDTYRRVLIEDTVYLVGEKTKSVLRAHVPTLISRATGAVWETLPNTTLKWSTPVAIENTLLTVGGCTGVHIDDNPKSSIHIHNPTKNQWIKVGDLPEPMAGCCCTVLSGELIVLKKHVYVAKLDVRY